MDGIETKYIPGIEVGLDMYGLTGEVELVWGEEEGEVAASLFIYINLDFLSEEELEEFNPLSVANHYNAVDNGAGLDRFALGYSNVYDIDETDEGIIDDLLDKAGWLIADLQTDAFDKIAKAACKP